MINDYRIVGEPTICTLEELVDIIVDSATEGGIDLEVMIKVYNGKPVENNVIVVAQNEWMYEQVCLMGGFGKGIQALPYDSPKEKILEALKKYCCTDTVVYTPIEYSF